MNNNTLFFGQNLIKVDTCPSTNNYLKELLANTKPLPEGSVIMAVHQSQGRGQSGNFWFTEMGKNLSLSYALYPNFIDITQQFHLNIAICLGIRDTFKHYLGSNCKIKWPNDIYYEQKKMAGVLIENSAIGSQIRQSVVGIGMNINQQKFPKSLANAGSLFQFLNVEVELMEVFHLLSQNLEYRYLQLRNKKLKELKEEYENHLFGKFEIRKFSINEKIIDGEVMGVNETGQLIIRSEKQMLLFDFKQIQFLF